MTATPEATIRELVATDYRTAAVFERHGLDFCCSGCRTIEQACREAGIDADPVLRELDTVLHAPASDTPDFNSWDAAALITRIVHRHHGYVRQAIPALIQHTSKIASVHGTRHPELVHIAGLFHRVADEMTEHMFKEEQILFPFIIALENAREQNRPAPFAPFGTVNNPVRMMLAEHDTAGDLLREMRKVSSDYALPADACISFKTFYEAVEAFEQDLHQHIHLENNLLFPKAIALEESL